MVAEEGRGSADLLIDIKNLIISHKTFPVEGYEFPQEKVADFWKSVFAERGIRVFGLDEAPAGVHVMQTGFTLPDTPPDWLILQEE
jgi:hypothetical protein